MFNLKSKKIKENTCTICGNVSDNGIIVKDNLICPSCEIDIVNLTLVEDNYDYYVDKIKNLYK